MRDIEKVISTLRDEQEPLDAAQLYAMSNLTREEQQVLGAAWPAIPLDKRRRMVEWMGELADEDIQQDYSAVFRQGLGDADAEVRRLSVDGLWENESISLVRPLLAMVRGDESMAVRASAASALGRFVFQGEMEQLSAERLAEIVEALVAVVGNGDLPRLVRRRAVEALGYSSDARVRPIIERAYEDASDEMRISAIFAMGRTADRYWSGTVRTELNNDQAAFRFEAARAAGELADPQAVYRLVALLSDSDKEVREMAVWALGEVGGPVAKKALQEVVKGNDRDMRRLARESLAEIALFDEEGPAFYFAADLEAEAGPEEDVDEDFDDEEWDDEDDLDEDFDEELDDDEDWDDDDEDWDEEEWDEDDLDEEAEEV